jgi:putative Mg2+ transporter-C (MgtC) family protein
MLAIWINDLELAVSGWAGALGWPTEGILRLILAAVAGGIIGLEREIRVKHAGFRTMLLVCLGCATAMLVSVHFSMVNWPGQSADQVRLSVDPGRIAYGVMSGVGFLGAGTIIQRRDAARGLTTAAAIWCVAAIGLAFGFGLYVLGFASVALVLAALWLLNYLEAYLPSRRTREVTVRRRFHPNVMNQTADAFRKFRLDVRSVGMARVDSADEFVDVTLSIAYTDSDDYLGFEGSMETSDDFRLIASREI